jgi:hypothetical protein
MGDLNNGQSGDTQREESGRERYVRDEPGRQAHAEGEHQKQIAGGSYELQAGKAAREIAVANANTKPKSAYGRMVVGAFFGEQIFSFRPNEMRFLKEYGPDVSLEDAAKKAGVTVEFAGRMLKRRPVREFLADKFQQIAVQHGWTVERWFSEGDKVWRGQRAITREQLDIWKEFGARILPKKAAGADGGQEKTQITINIGAVDEAFKRQKAIEAQLLDGTGRSV